MIGWALVSVLALAIVTFALGFVCGKDSGRRHAQRLALEASSRRALAFREAAAGARRSAFPASRVIREERSGAARS